MMIKHSKWVERDFSGKPDAGLFPMIVERLRGTPARIEEKVMMCTAEILVGRRNDEWSIQEHVGHLLDLETLWSGRIEDFQSGAEELRPADMTNRKTHQANHNDESIDAIITEFRRVRADMIATLDAMSAREAVAVALHPRLKQPMRVIDLCSFVAEHDDHHLARITGLMRALAE
jgi:uncharacterized damage-inducible protein DinB